jgi:hypothetical protein
MKKTILIIMVLSFGFGTLKSQFRTGDTLAGNVVHYLGIYAGGASMTEDKKFGFALRADYEYRLIKSSFGFGLNTQLLVSDMTEIMIGVPFYLHNFTAWKLRLDLTPGVAITKRVLYSRSVPDTTTFVPTKNTGNFFLRGGIGWETFIYRDADPILVLTPSLSFDLISESKLYIGLGASLCWIIY